MTMQAEQYAVRADFAHAVTNACQRFAGALLTIEPDIFVDAVTRLTLDVPGTESPAERVVGWTLLQHAVLLGALAHHTMFHRCFGHAPCKFDTPRSDSGHAPRQPSFDALIRWATDCARAFDAGHAWPPAVRAARLLQKAPASAWYVNDVARAVGVSAATLERSFKKIYGLGVQQYQSLVRLRAVARTLRADASAIEGVILDLGYRSVKDVYVPFRRITGMTPAMVRQLTESQFALLVDGPLALPVPGYPHELPQTA
jgi:AraC-like DNA-binding protein